MLPTRTFLVLWVDHNSSKLLPGSVLDRSALTMQFRQEMANRATQLQQELDREEEESESAAMAAAANLFKPRPRVLTPSSTTALQDNINNYDINNYNNDGSLGLAPGLALVGLGSSAEAFPGGLSSSLHLLSSSQEQGLGLGLVVEQGPGQPSVPPHKQQKQQRKSQNSSSSNTNQPSQQPRFVLSREGMLVKPPDPNVILQNSNRRTNSRGLPLPTGGTSAQRRMRGTSNPLSAAPTQGQGLGPGLGLDQGSERDQPGFDPTDPLMWPDLLPHTNERSPGNSPSHKGPSGPWADSMSDR